jgi:hypothetical protein
MLNRRFRGVEIDWTDAISIGWVDILEVTLQQKAKLQHEAEVLHDIPLHTVLCHLEEHGL